MKLGPLFVYRGDFRLIDFSGFRYFRGTVKTFGLRSAILMLSPITNLIVHYRLRFACK